MIYFNFKERPAELFDLIVEIKVLNAKKVLKDALIGSFKVSSPNSILYSRGLGSTPVAVVLIPCYALPLPV